jgi:TfoX/Sxy family transcriptional regulator of competence genes
MATDLSFVEYVIEQSGLDDRITSKRMFGEYGIYIDGKVVAFACDNSLFIKAADATTALTASLPHRPPYPGAKPYPVADELLDDADQLQVLLVATASAMPEPRPRKPKKPKQSASK